MDPLRICICSQTPLLQFISERARRHVFGPFNRPSDLTGLVEGTDYRYSPGGVTRMVLPLVRELQRQGVLGEAHWISLNSAAPPTVRIPGLVLHSIALDRGRMSHYGATKEVLWSTIHGGGGSAAAAELFWTDAFTEYGYFNRRTAERIRELDKEHDFDLVYVHDFQLLPLGSMLGSLTPRLLRWHIPFEADAIPPLWRDRLVSYLGAYDRVIVSTRGYQTELRRFGFPGRVVRIPPYVDPTEYSRPGKAAVEQTAERFGIAPGDEVILVVARMDPMKGQDTAIRALAALLPRRPAARLVLVGNGSFSSTKGGLGLSKGALWRGELERLANRLGVGERVTFTGHVSQTELDALYERSLFTILPSVQEGFGLVVVESWLHARPAIVTRRAGIADLVVPGRNGLLCDPGDAKEIARKARWLLERPARRLRMGRSGRSTARRCTVSAASRREARLFAEVVEA